jgi:hypothetical protein
MKFLVIAACFLVAACKSSLTELKKDSRRDFVISNRVLFKAKLAEKEFTEKPLSDIPCSIFSSPGTLFGKTEEPIFAKGTIIENRIFFRFSEHGFQEGNYPKKYSENPALKASVHISPDTVKITRFSHFCAGYPSGFFDKLTLSGVLIIYSDGPFALKGQITLGNNEIISIDVTVPSAGFHVLRYEKINQAEVLKYSTKHDITLSLLGEQL